MANFGDTSLKLQPGAKYTVHRNGLATYDLQYRGIVEGDDPPFQIMQGDPPQDGKYDNLVLLNFSISTGGEACNELIVDLHYEGKDTSHTQRYVAEELLVDVITSHEPIESHPDFVTHIGGQLGSEKHGAKFIQSGEQAGKFDFFAIVDPDEPTALPSRFAGITSYLMPQLTITQNDIDEAWPDSDELELVGKSVILPFENPPNLPGERNWLYTGLRIRNIANVCFEVQRVYMESGPRGWVPEIYAADEV